MNNLIATIVYAGEHLGLKSAGETFIVLALAGALLSFGAYIVFNINGKSSWKTAARALYVFHFLSVTGAGAILFVILFGLHYEFSYVWQHTASYLDTKYIVSAFWAGQEGSFLLWVFFEGLLGLVAMGTSKTFESYIMPVIAGAQFLLTTMVWGIKPGGFVIGQSPFMLLRQEAANAGADFFNNPSYLSQITDGNGINPLLENIWMVTHPPLLFLGYSAAVIPFAYAIAALWKGDFKSWLKPAFPWVIVSIITLGGGILLGGAWAYESLTFGGFWAWDPVENASLIPWLFIVAAFHMMILNKKRNHSYALSFLFLILGYVFVVYASYLTRSGVLGETSAHAFGNNGLSAQMVIIILLTMAVSFFLYLKNIRKFPSSVQDRFFSREFWMYLGALVLVLSAFQVFAATSIPVFNKILGTHIAPPADPVAFYNKWQLPFAIAIVFILGGSLVLRYGKNNEKNLFKRFTLVFAAAAVLFFGEVLLFKISGWAFLLFLLFINFAITSSVYLLFSSKTSIQNWANSLSHMGFGIFLLGVLAAFSNSVIITKNTSKYDLGDSKSNNENQVLLKGKAEKLGDYFVVYDSLSRNKNYLHYTINFFKDKELKELAFAIHPDININSRMGNVYNPSTHHTFARDIFTYITYANIEADYNNYQYLTALNKELSEGDSINFAAGKLIFTGTGIVGQKDSIDINNIKIKALFKLLKPDGDTLALEAFYVIEKGRKNYIDASVNDGEYLLRFNDISTKPNSINIALYKKRLNYIVIKSTLFPWISLLLIGGGIMFTGLFLSFYRFYRGKL